ncbi:MAG: ion channel [Hyphomicrobium sp.]
MKLSQKETKLAFREFVLFVASLGFVSLVGIGVSGNFNALFFSMIASAAIASILIRNLFPKRMFFSLTFINLLAIYASIFSFFMEELFGNIPPRISGVGFSFPVLAFLCGCLIWRKQIEKFVDDPQIRDGRALFGSFFWLFPVFAVGTGAFLLSLFFNLEINNERTFLLTMLLISIIVLSVSQNVSIFLVDAGLLLEEFFQRMSRMTIPAFAFLTFYSLAVIAFAAIYTLISQNIGGPHFRVDGISRSINFSEAIHFSIVTISTVGYGDIIPLSSSARLLASTEVICGVMLLLFGVSELLEYTREHRKDQTRKL